MLKTNLESKSDQIKIQESELTLLKSNLKEQTSNVESLFNQIQLSSLKVAQLNTALDESNSRTSV
jgi:septal ring factor EnvC (AmiA/AmiB activator)